MRIKQVKKSFYSFTTDQQSENTSRVLYLIILAVLMLHILFIILFRQYGQQYAQQLEQQRVDSKAVPFKLEVSMISTQASKTEKQTEKSPEITPKITEDTKKTTDKNKEEKKVVEKRITEKQKTEDYAAIEQLLKTAPRKLATQMIRRQPDSHSVQAVASEVIHSHTKASNAIDNFPESDEHNPSPEYPDMAIFLGYQGTAVVKINVSAKGVSQGVELLDSSGHKLLDDSATKALKHWRFTATKQSDSVIVVVHYILR